MKKINVNLKNNLLENEYSEDIMKEIEESQVIQKIKMNLFDEINRQLNYKD